MTDTYATRTDLVARVTLYTVPTDVAAILVKASELIDHVTLGRAQEAWEVGEDAVTGAAATDLFTASAAHGLSALQPVRFIALTGGAGLALNTVYYVAADGLTTTAFKVSATKGGAVVDFTTDVTAGTVRTETKTLITNATCDQVEYWFETGEEHDVLGLRGALQGGRVQLNQIPGTLGQRARRTLTRAGLLWSGVPSL